MYDSRPAQTEQTPLILELTVARIPERVAKWTLIDTECLLQLSHTLCLLIISYNYTCAKLTCGTQKRTAVQMAKCTSRDDIHHFKWCTVAKL